MRRLSGEVEIGVVAAVKAAAQAETRLPLGQDAAKITGQRGIGICVDAINRQSASAASRCGSASR
jgi:hypothetical protein